MWRYAFGIDVQKIAILGSSPEHYNAELDRNSVSTLPVFLISWAKGWSKYLRPGFKPCDEAARRFLGYVMWWPYSGRVHESLTKCEKTSASPVFEENVERFLCLLFSITHTHDQSMETSGWIALWKSTMASYQQRFRIKWSKVLIMQCFWGHLIW